MKSDSTLELVRDEVLEDPADLTPKILIAGTKADLLGLKDPVHMCSNCWNSKVEID